MMVIMALALSLIGLTLVASGLYIPAKAWLAQVLLAQAWEHRQLGVEAPKPWPWADTHPIAKLHAPRLDAEVLILSGGSGRTMAFGPGHLEGTGEPGGDDHAIIAAHRDTHFAFLKHIRHGDRLVIERPDGSLHTYRVIERTVMNADRDSLWLDHGQRLLTLVTCYPFESMNPGGSLRYVVTASAEPA